MSKFVYFLRDQNLAIFAKLFAGKSGIYRWVNLVNGKRCVGSSVDLQRRLGEYLNPIRLAAELLRGESIIYRALLKYGYSNFTFEVLEFVNIDGALSNEERDALLLSREQYYIDLLNPEYNILKMAGSNRGHKMSEETRAKMSAAKKGQPSHRKGGSFGEETRAKMSASSAMSKGVFVYDANGVFVDSYLTMTKAAEATGISRFRIGRNMDNGLCLDGKYSFSTTSKS